MRLAAWRREKGLTQEQLAALLDCSQPYISYLERSTAASLPSNDFLTKLYRATLGAVTPNDIVFPDGLPDLETLELALDAPAPLLDANHEAAASEEQLQDIAA